MSAMNPYRTLRQFASDEFIINKSRFIGYAAPCETEAEALAFLQSIRTKHKDATHNCYAYIIGQNAGIMRYSDDGEPGGTAGLPMMEVLKHQGVVNCCCVVTRYFGGVLLGAGGLVRAYTQGAVVALKAAPLLPIPVRSRLSAVGQGAVRAEKPARAIAEQRVHDRRRLHAADSPDGRAICPGHADPRHRRAH